jgi:hypothetical protein
VSCRQFPFNIRSDLEVVVPAPLKPFRQGFGSASKQHNTVDIEEMGQMPVHHNTRTGRRNPSIGQPVDVDGRCSIAGINLIQATMLFG